MKKILGILFVTLLVMTGSPVFALFGSPETTVPIPGGLPGGNVYVGPGAQTSQDVISFFSTPAQATSTIDKITLLIIKPLIVLLFALAVMYFLYGLLKFLQNQENASEKEAGKRHMVWGVIGVTIMMVVGGILNIISQTLSRLY